jgi:hypothetical protein
MFFAEAGIAVPAVTIAILIVVISPVLPPMVVVVVPSLGALWRQRNASGYHKKHQ